MKKKIDTSDLSMDDFMREGLIAIRDVIRDAAAKAAVATHTRDTISNLRDAMTLLMELKDREAAILDTMSDAELAEAAKGD